jgi:hypothetical protein
MTMSNSKKWLGGIIGCIIFIALILRVFGINQNLGLYWVDEMASSGYIFSFPEIFARSLFLDFPQENALILDVLCHPQFFNLISGIILFPLKIIWDMSYLGIFTIPGYSAMEFKFIIYYFVRLLSAGFGVATIYLIYHIGKREYCVWTGILAALFLTFSANHIFFSHIAIPYVFAGFMTTLSIYSYTRIYKNPSTMNYIFSAIVTGFSIATYYILAIIFIPFIFTHFYSNYKKSNMNFSFSFKIFLEKAILDKKVVIISLVTLLSFFIANPFFILAPFRFFEVIRFYISARQLAEGGLQTGNIFLNHITHLFHAFSCGSPQAVGIPMMVIIIIGIIYAFKRRDFIDYLLLSLVIPFFIMAGTWDKIYGRYFLPFLPASLILASNFLVVGLQGNREKKIEVAKKILFWAIIIAVIVYSAFLSLAYLNLMLGEDTRETSSKWIYENVPEGSSIGIKSKGTITSLSWWYQPYIAYSEHKYFANLTKYSDKEHRYNLTYYTDYPDYVVLTERTYPFFENILESEYLINYTWTGEPYIGESEEGEPIPSETFMFFDDVLNGKQQRFKYKLVAKFEKNPHFLGFERKKNDPFLSPTILIYQKS